MKPEKTEENNQQIKCFITIKEFNKVNKICADLGITKSALIRNRLFHPDSIDVDRSKLLQILSEIGSAMSSINTIIHLEYSANRSVGEMNSRTQKMAELFLSYQVLQSSLENQIRKLLVRINESEG